MLHADDQSLPASSLQTAQETLAIASKWSKESEQEYHVAPEKTVVIFLSGHWQQDALKRNPLTIDGKMLHEAEKHKWLGAVWAKDLDFSEHLSQRIKSVWGAVKPTLALARIGGYPVHILAEMAAAKCRGALFVGFVLLLMVPDAEQRINQQQADIARALLQGHPYAKKEVVLGELEWRPWWIEIVRQCLVKDASAHVGLGSPWLKRLYRLPTGTLQGPQWNTMLQQHAHRLDMVTFMEFLNGHAPNPEAFRAYRKYIDECATGVWEQQWRVECAKVLEPYPYCTVADRPKSIVKEMAAGGTNWKTSVKATSWIRARAGLLLLGRSTSGKPTSKSTASCRSCGQSHGGTLHHLVTCPAHQDLHNNFDACLAKEQDHMLRDPRQRAWFIFNSSLDRIELRVSYVHEIVEHLEKKAVMLSVLVPTRLFWGTANTALPAAKHRPSPTRVTNCAQQQQLG